MGHWLWIILAALFFGLLAADRISPVEDEVSGREGESVTLRCNYETTSNNVWLYWYSHHSDLKAPQFILWKGAKGETREYIPDKRYESQTSTTSTELTIKSLTLEDTALYYCAVRGAGGLALTFGKPIQLTVSPKDETPVNPTLVVMSPLHFANDSAPDVCLAADFYPKKGEMILNVDGGSETRNITNAAMSKIHKKYFYVGFSNQTIHSCELQDGSPSSNYYVDLCADFHPEKAKLNFYLLVMNGVRIVFTKTLAFNTLLTIKAMLF